MLYRWTTQPTLKKKKERKKEKKKETTGQKYNGLPYSTGQP